MNQVAIGGGMRLRRHREDVKALKNHTWNGDLGMEEIAKRYQRLIRAFEQATEKHLEQGYSIEDLKKQNARAELRHLFGDDVNDSRYSFGWSNPREIYK